MEALRVPIPFHIVGTVILGYAMSGQGAERQAMGVFSAAFLLSALAGACLPAGDECGGHARAPRMRPAGG